ncbi:MAG: amino acid adenylation domain-containing protein, partial [Actinomycetota bacterium]|nr:amino acid adenylation domain-containing protein [Actinomycetota bacterium]
YQTIVELAAAVTAELSSGPVSELADREAVAGPAPLTPIQRWFFATYGAQLHFNQSVTVELAEDLDTDALSAAVDAVVAHHPALRMRLSTVEGQWCQDVVPSESAEVLRQLDLSDLNGEDRLVAAMAQAAAGAQTGLDITSGPLLRAVLFHCGPGRRPQLFIAVHHLVVDGVSWRILLADLESAYQQARCAPGAVTLPPTGTSFTAWAHRLARHVQAGGLDVDLGYWSQVVHQSQEAPDLPVTRAGANTAGSSREVSVRLGRDDTDALLHQVPGVYRTQINDVLMSALGRVLSTWTGHQRVLIALEGHGREEILDGVDLSRTIGWFTTQFPVALTVPAGSDWRAVLMSVKEQLRAIPHRGLSYGALRYLSPENSAARMLRDVAQPQICLNYHGQWDTAQWNTAQNTRGLYRGWPDGLAPDQAPENVRVYLLDVTGLVRNGELELRWTYSDNVHDEATVAQLAANMVQALRDIVAHCSQPEAGGATPSDFPLAGLDQAGVDRVVGDGRRVEDVFRLTSLQAGMVFHHLVDADSAAYVDQLRLRLSGVSDAQALGVACQRVADRTATLRSAVVWEGVDEPLQVVYRHVVVPIRYYDWRGLSAEQRERELAQVVAQDRAAGMDLAVAPLLRVAIATLTDDEVLLMWTSHHVMLDGWSLGQVFTEVAEQYTAIVHGRAPKLVTRRPLRDYLQWLDTRDQSQAQLYWQRVLAGWCAPTGLPYDRQPRQAHRAESAESVPVQLSTEESARLQLVARRGGLTLNTIVQGVWALLLSRYSGEREVVFGTVVSGRPAELVGVESMVGMFINTVPTRVQVDDGAELLPWLRELQVQQSGSRRFDFVSLAQLQAWSDLPAGANLFNSVAVFENYPFEEAPEGRPGLRIREVSARDTTNFPLSLRAYLAGQLHVELGYDPRLFDARTVTTLAARLRLLLTGIADEPDRPLGQLPWMSAQERHQVLVEFNDTDRAVPPATLAELFQAQMLRSPTAPAVISEDGDVSFAQLNARANRLARLLVQHGAGPERVVGLALPRSVDIVVAQLAVMKAGAAFVPLDPNYPAERIAFMVADAAPLAVLTHRNVADRVAGVSDIPVVALDEPSVVSAMSTMGEDDLTDADRSAPLRLTHPAYVIYTSGSTGRPKGVVVTHTGLASFSAAEADRYAVAAGDRVLQFSSPSFDASMLELCMSLPVGATLVVPPPGPLLGEELARVLVKHRVTHALIPPAALATVPAPAAAQLPLFQTLVVGGDVCPPQLVARWAPDRRMINSYGPTEATVVATWSQPLTPGQEAPPIGGPIWNTRVYVLDAQLRPVPVGVPGELYLTGGGLARGYLNRPGLTAQRFVSSPFGPPGSRMYRTGDVVRWNAAGELEYLGRVDHQVKIRGFRVELGEIEAVLARHPDVDEVVVTALTEDNASGLARLVAYVVPAGAQAPTPFGLRSFLGNILPDYMVPAAFMLLDG